MNALKVVAAKLAAGIGTRPLRLAHYWRWALAVWCACLATTAGFQIIVDPYCAYGGWSGFDRYKLFAKRDEAKAETLIRLRPHTLILGTSRAMAFNPASPLWGPQPAFNLGLPAAPQQRVAQAFETACLHAPVKRVFLCVDFYQYGCDPSPRSFHRSRLSPDFSAMRYHFDNLFSQKSFEASQEVVRGYLLGKPSDFTPWTGLATGRFHTQRRPRDLFVSMAEGYAKIYESYGRRESEFAALARIVRTCREREIELIVATAPVHAVHLEILHSLGMAGDYEQWLRDVVRTVSDESGGKVAVWDFAGYSPYTTEPAPRDDTSPVMRYHQEPAHFTTELADLVLARVFDAPGAALDFGAKVTPDTLESHLVSVRAQRLAWLAEAPADLACVPKAKPALIADRPTGTTAR